MMMEECDSKNCDASVEILGRLLLLKNNIEKIIYGAWWKNVDGRENFEERNTTCIL